MGGYPDLYNHLLVASKSMRIFVLLLFAVVGSLRAATYQQTFDLPPLQLNASQLGGILKTLSETVARGNSGAPTNRHAEYSVTITDDSTGRTVTFDEFSIPEGRLPSPATTLSIGYSFYEAPISRIDVMLYDSFRTLKVSGTSYTDVTGSAALLQREFSRYSVPFGGLRFRWMMYAIAQMSFMVLGFLFQYTGRARQGFVFFGLSLITVLSLLVVPWGLILPGFVFHQSEASWLVRYSAHFTFLGFLLALLIPVSQPLLAGKRQKQRRQKKQHDTSPKAE